MTELDASSEDVEWALSVAREESWNVAPFHVEADSGDWMRRFWDGFWARLEPSAARVQSFQSREDGEVYCERCDVLMTDALSTLTVHNGRRHENDLDT